MKVTAFSKPVNSVTLGILSTGYVSTSSNSYAAAVASNSYAINGVTVTGAAASNYHILASSPTAAAWVPDSGAGSTIGSVTVSGAAASNYHILASSSTAAAWVPDSGAGAVIAIAFVIDGGGATITTGVKGDLLVPFACTITQATTLADQSGSIVIDVWKDTYTNFPPVDGDSITASAPPTLSSATKAQDSTLTGWTTSIAAGDTLRFNVDSATTVQRVTLTLRATRS